MRCKKLFVGCKKAADLEFVVFGVSDRNSIVQVGVAEAKVEMKY